jgi:hypothetical protein
MKVRLLMTCREATQLCSEQHERSLTRRERWVLRVHLFLCHKCRKFAQQLSVMREALARMASAQTDSSPAKLSPERREAMKRELRKLV